MRKMTDAQCRAIARSAIKFCNTECDEKKKGRMRAQSVLLRFLLASRGMTSAGFARELGLTKQAMNQRLYWCKERTITAEEIETYCNVLKVQTDDFLEIVKNIKKFSAGEEK